MFTFANKPLSIGEVYGQSFSFYKDVFAKVWYWFFINMIIVGVVQFFASKYVIIGMQTSLTTLSRTQILIFIATNFLAFIISVYFISLVLHRMNILAGGMPESNSFQIVANKWFNLAVTKLLVALIVLLGAFIFVLPAVFFIVFLVFSIPAVLFEDKGPGGAIKRSFQLVWGNWWRTLVILIPAGVILAIGVFLPHLVSSLIPNNFAIYATTTIFFTIFVILVYAFLLVQYHDLKLRKAAKEQIKQD